MGKTASAAKSVLQKWVAAGVVGCLSLGLCALDRCLILDFNREAACLADWHPHFQRDAVPSGLHLGLVQSVLSESVHVSAYAGAPFLQPFRGACHSSFSKCEALDVSVGKVPIPHGLVLCLFVPDGKELHLTKMGGN